MPHSTRRVRLGAIALGASCLLVATACQQLLQGGLAVGQALLISDDDEVKIGQSAADQVLSDPKTPAYPNATVTDYVSAVGSKVAAVSDRPAVPYVFHVVLSDDVNAFALPGGQVFVTTSALKAMKNESELAGVLGHEITHVAKKHGLENLRTAMIAQGITTAALGSTPQLVQQAGSIAVGLVLKGFARQDETEADTFGVRYTNSAGYAPQGLPNFLQTLKDTLGDTPKAFEPLSDHPILTDRITALTQEISTEHLAATTTYADAFLGKTQPLR